MFEKPVSKITVLGGGTAGLLSAITLKRRLPGVEIKLIRSKAIPVIGVGEATTPWFVTFLHQMLGIPLKEFYKEVRPVWKLGNRLEWGEKSFNYPFGGKFLEAKYPNVSKEAVFFAMENGIEASSLYAALMDGGHSPMMRNSSGQVQLNPGFAYHIENRTFINYLERVAMERGIAIEEQVVEGVTRQGNGFIDELVFKDGERDRADFYIDCSGFRSQLLGGEMKVPYVSFSDSLFCDTALTGYWERTDEIKPYTTAETMDHGWCWRTEFENHVNRGYVFSSDFCSPDEAEFELRKKNPKICENLQLIKFPSGHYERFWAGNVAGVGNAMGFVEPLEATNLQMIGQTAVTIANVLADSDLQPMQAHVELANRHMDNWWCDIRGFLAIHFKYNKRLDTPFWKHCRESTDIAGACEFVEAYQSMGPNGLIQMLVPRETVFGFGGYYLMLIAQGVASAYHPRLRDTDQVNWRKNLEVFQKQARHALPMREALELVQGDGWRWE